MILISLPNTYHSLNFFDLITQVLHHSMLWLSELLSNEEAEVQPCKRNFHVLNLSCYTRLLPFLFLDLSIQKYHLNDNGEIKIIELD